jgi:hypothetical protein
MDDCECLSIQECYRYAEGVIVNRVHWLQAKAQFERWKEEQYIIHNEAAWVPAYFYTKEKLWNDQRSVAVQKQLDGHVAYALHQAHSWEELSRSSWNALAVITSAPLKHV